MNNRRSRIAATVFAVLTAANLTAVGFDSLIGEWLTKPALTLALIWYLLAAGGLKRPTSVLMVVGLAAACVADSALLIAGDLAFLVGMGFFLIMQLLYIRSMWRLKAFSRVNPALAIAYLLVVGGYVVVMWPKLGDLAAPMLGYGLALTTMAVLASGLNVRAGIGGALFFVSDLTIGLGIGGFDFAQRGLVVMSTYIAAQFLIVSGWLAATEKAESAEVPAPE